MLPLSPKDAKHHVAAQLRTQEEQAGGPYCTNKPNRITLTGQKAKSPERAKFSVSFLSFAPLLHHRLLLPEVVCLSSSVLFLSFFLPLFLCFASLPRSLSLPLSLSLSLSLSLPPCLLLMFVHWIDVQRLNLLRSPCRALCRLAFGMHLVYAASRCWEHRLKLKNMFVGLINSLRPLTQAGAASQPANKQAQRQTGK